MFAPPGGLEPPTFRLTAERASRLRHGGMVMEGREACSLKERKDFLNCEDSAMTFLPPVYSSVMV